MGNIMKKNSSIQLCQTYCTNDDLDVEIKCKMPTDCNFMDTSELFKAFSDTTRLRILKLLALSEMCVCDIVKLLDMTQPAISYHLKLLKLMRLVKYRKVGKYVFYSLSDEYIHQILNAGFEHIKMKNCKQ